MTTDHLARTPKPPYYAVIFTSVRTPGDGGYASMADRMVELAAEQPGYLGMESVRDAAGVGITVSYWTSEQAIADWKANAEHAAARDTGREHWYQAFELRVARVERAYGFLRPSGHTEHAP
ncbi:antibiotic biosynthesis monooxygenase [Hydrogenophaga sp. 5NK40-0174]|uniref:antibiotic biosynthesis monooxygenase family protein n=1 Tax=Hydrogenophaga sp. 5NK40-0174 TaxID=3127649 RepID=UPI0031039E7C